MLERNSKKSNEILASIGYALARLVDALKMNESSVEALLSFLNALSDFVQLVSRSASRILRPQKMEKSAKAATGLPE